MREKRRHGGDPIPYTILCIVLGRFRAETVKSKGIEIVS